MITEKDILQTANLAKLEIIEAELPLYINKLRSLLDFAEAVNSAEITAENLKEIFLDYKNMREDEVKKSLIESEATANAKESQDGFIKLTKRA